ncbi:MAG TPA: OFA family MFS transporter [Clostridiales bacterium]|jgi:MFS transporter, OFA family, oxalate/formate antiporter|nr:OFA family MFS transporter [Clostridiales bacterium]HQP70078.1 OFA family MFS transporter [Clostridiales bacterium]
MTAQEIKNRGWTVAGAGLFINLALGILYTWSVFKESIKKSIETGGENAFTWDIASLNDPYAVCTLTFALSMIAAGKLQDKKGPLLTALIGGVFVGIGFILVSFTTSYAMWVIGFGLLAGTGIGFGYSAATPPALKWFHSSKTGMVSGIVVSGFGLAPVYIAPLATYLVNNYGLQRTMLVFGIAFIIIVCGAAMLLKNPPQGYVPAQGNVQASSNKNANTTENHGPGYMLKTPVFYLMWITFFISSGAGLMVIANISGLAKKSMGEAAFVAVAIMAIGNASGRIIAGLVSDKIGRILTLSIIILFQAILMFMAIKIVSGDSSPLVIVLLATFIGFNYGTNLSLFPTLTKGYWGLKNFGMNYGILMSAWGLGGLVFSSISQRLASSGNSNLSFIIAGASLLITLVFTFILNRIKHKAE